MVDIKRLKGVKNVGVCCHCKELAGVVHEELIYLAEQLGGLDKRQKVAAALYMECLAGRKLNIGGEQGNQASEMSF